MPRTGGCEIDIAAVLGMLGREDVVEHGALVEVCILSLRRHPEEVFRQLEHIVGVAGLRTVVVIDKIYAGCRAGEMLAAAVASECQRTVVRHRPPEVAAGLGIVGRVAELADAHESHCFRHLRVGVEIVQTVLVACEWLEDELVGIPLGRGEILFVASHCISIGEHLVHTALLVAHHLLHLRVAEIGSDVDAPVAEAEEEFLGFLIAAVEPGVAKSCVHLVDVVERGPGR